MHVVLSLMLMQECCNLVLGNSLVNWKMYQGGCAYKNKALITAVRYGEIFHHILR